MKQRICVLLAVALLCLLAACARAEPPPETATTTKSTAEQPTEINTSMRVVSIIFAVNMWSAYVCFLFCACLIVNAFLSNILYWERYEKAIFLSVVLFILAAVVVLCLLIVPWRAEVVLQFREMNQFFVEIIANTSHGLFIAIFKLVCLIPVSFIWFRVCIWIVESDRRNPYDYIVTFILCIAPQFVLKIFLQYGPAIAKFLQNEISGHSYYIATLASILTIISIISGGIVFLSKREKSDTNEETKSEKIH